MLKRILNYIFNLNDEDFHLNNEIPKTISRNGSGTYGSYYVPLFIAPNKIHKYHHKIEHEGRIYTYTGHSYYTYYAGHLAFVYADENHRIDINDSGNFTGD